MHTYKRTYIHTYIQTYKHTYIHTYIHTHLHTFVHACIHTYIHTFIHTYIHAYINTHIHTYIYTCTTVACLPPIRGLEKCRVIGHNPHFSSLCSLSCLKPKVLPKGILFSECDWWKAVNCGPSHIDPSEAVVYVIPSGLLGSTSHHLGYITYTTASLRSIYHLHIHVHTYLHKYRCRVKNIYCIY